MLARRIGVVLLVSALASCDREERPFRVQPPSAGMVQAVELTTLRAGPSTAPTTSPVGSSLAYIHNPYEDNAWALSEGKRLFSSMNCVGCHAHGGGGMGPPLMDEDCIYGSQSAQVFSTIVEGRPNGMPSFRGRIPDHQVWQIAAYVRSISGQLSPAASPGRDDDMQMNPPEHSKDPEQPKGSSRPPGGEMPR